MKFERVRLGEAGLISSGFRLARAHQEDRGGEREGGFFVPRRESRSLFPRRFRLAQQETPGIASERDPAETGGAKARDAWEGWGAEAAPVKRGIVSLERIFGVTGGVAGGMRGIEEAGNGDGGARAGNESGVLTMHEWNEEDGWREMGGGGGGGGGGGMRQGGSNGTQNNHAETGQVGRHGGNYYEASAGHVQGYSRGGEEEDWRERGRETGRGRERETGRERESDAERDPSEPSSATALIVEADIVQQGRHGHNIPGHLATPLGGGVAGGGGSGRYYSKDAWAAAAEEWARNVIPFHEIESYRSELSGMLGDLGLYIPLVIALSLTGQIRLAPTLFFSGLSNVITGLKFKVETRMHTTCPTP